MLIFRAGKYNSSRVATVICILLLGMPFLSWSQGKDPFQQYRTVSSVKAWESTSRYIYVSPNDVIVNLYPEPRLGPTGFAAGGYDKKQEVQGIFNGTCESIMRIDVTLKDWRTFDFAAYEQSGNAKHLPIQNTLNAMGDVFEVQCPELKGFKINAVVLYKQVPEFKGHALTANGWKLIDGMPNDGFGDDFQINIQMSTSFMGADGLIVQHRGKCEKEPTLLIKRHFLNDTQRAFPQKLMVNDFQQVASAATKQYASECPNVETIRFRIGNGVLPDKYDCNKPEECLTAEKSQNWAVESTAIALRSPEESRKKDCLSDTFCGYRGGDLLNAIYAGNFSHFQKLDLEYTKGYSDFLEAQNTGNPILDNLFKRASIIDSVINEYMFLYKSASQSCLRPEFKTLVFKRRTSDIVLENIYGVEAHRVPGANLESSYTVNREFVSTCKEVCSAVGGSSLLSQMGDGWLNKGMRSEVLNGIKDMMNKETCNSEQIQQFEENLLGFYKRIN